MAQVQALPTARGLQQHGHPAPQLVGHDTSGTPLFAMPGLAGVHPLQQYPMPAQVPVHPGAAMHPRSTIPRPVVDSAGPVDPALQRSAFQRPTPYAPGQAQPAAAHEQVPVHALG